VSLTPVRMPDYKPMGARRFKPLRDKAPAEPRVARILGIPAQDLMDALALACCAGCAVLFSPTSDGGAISVTVYLGDDRLRDYAASAEEFAEVLVAVRDAAEAHTIRPTHPALKIAQKASQST
jgi:transposase